MRTHLRLAIAVVLLTGAGARAPAETMNPPGAPDDHFLCYRARTAAGTPAFGPVKGVALVDALLGRTVEVRKVRGFCTPAAADGLAVVDPDLHLTDVQIKGPLPVPRHALGVVNRLGALLLDVSKPDVLLLPTSQGTDVPPPPPDPRLHAVDHYQCYRVRPSAGAPRFPAGMRVAIEDQFTSPSRVLEVRKPRRLCLPVDKNGEGIKNPGGHLLCYQVRAASGQPRPARQASLALAHQFGSLRLATTRETDLCVPSVVDFPPPPDPATVAPPLDPSLPADLGADTEFLYTGPEPIQTGVAPGTITRARAALLRGRVTDRAAAPLASVTIAVLGHPELGQTLSRVDGRFDLVVNGGGELIVTYAKAGYLPVQRQAAVPWQGAVVLPDVALTTLDAEVTPIALPGSTPFQVARGSAVIDQDGPRQATLLFPQGTQASLVRADGSSEPLTRLGVRATEYTTGPSGPAAMPGALPPNVGYTYAVELSADEALGAGAARVEFSLAPLLYVENFLRFPIGEAVPLGYHDRQRGQWIASESGRVVQIVGVSGGVADVDTDGDGTADNLGLGVEEREQLALLYAAGTSLWRVAIPHFSAWDCNWPFAPPPDAGPPPPDPPEPGDGPPPREGPPDPEGDGRGGGGPRRRGPREPPLEDDDGPPKGDECEREGSVIRCQTQRLGESVPITGTAYRLQYQSDRVPGRRSARTFTISLRGATVPGSLLEILVEVAVAGQRHAFSRSPADTTLAFTWDGRDAYGRPVKGQQLATVRVGYVYRGVYRRTTRFGEYGDATITGSRTREVVVLWREHRVPIGAWDARAIGLGGWSVSQHHVYDPAGRVVYFGNGGQLSAAAIGAVITRAAGTGDPGTTGDGGPATAARLDAPHDVAVGPDGSLYLADVAGAVVRRVAPDGTITRVAGTGVECAPPTDACGDGGPATAARLNDPRSVAVAPDGTVYIADSDIHRIRRVDPSGAISTFAGTGEDCFPPDACGDGGRATAARLREPFDLALGPDGSLYVADGVLHRIRRIGPDGTIRNVTGTNESGPAVEGVPAGAAQYDGPRGIAVGADGSLYIGDRVNNRIRKLGTDGLVRTVAGDGTHGISGEGQVATSVRVAEPQGLSVGPDGSLYFCDMLDGVGNEHPVVRRIGADGIVTTIAGNGTTCATCGDTGLATAAGLRAPRGTALGPDGSLYLASTTGHVIRRVAPAMPGVGPASFLLPSEDGRQAFRFDARGRHLATLDGLTGLERLGFGYDPTGRLASLTDRDGAVTRIARSGGTVVVTAPGGQTTTLAVPADSGYTAAITNDAGETFRATYGTADAEGLLLGFRVPRADVAEPHRFTYDALGRLATDHDPALAPADQPATLDRTSDASGVTVRLTSPLGRVRTYRTERLPDGRIRSVNAAPSGLAATTEIAADGTRATTFADGAVRSFTARPDPRFGMLAPRFDRTFTTPGGRRLQRTVERTVTLSNPLDLLSVVSATRTITINQDPSRRFVRAYTTVPARSVTLTPPTGREDRTRTLTLDATGRVVSDTPGGLAPIQYSYDASFPGSLDRVTRGSGPEARSLTLEYDARRRVRRLIDSEAASGDVELRYDAADRIDRLVLPGTNREVFLEHDASGNPTAVTPPGRPPHRFSYTAVDRPSSYTAPPATAGGNPAATTYVYNADRQLELITRPDGQTVDPQYEAGSGRLATLAVPDGVYTHGYHPSGPGAGRVSTITTTVPLTSALAFTYDGPLRTETAWTGLVPGTVTVSRTHDDDLRVASTSVNGTDTVTLRYDADGLLTQAGAVTVERAGPQGPVSRVEMGPEAGPRVVETRTYNGFGELATVTATFDGAPLLELAYPRRDQLGRILERTEALQGGPVTTLTYAYDAAGRLREATRNGVPGTYTYDANGNRLTAPGVGGPVVHDDQDRLRHYGGATYDYTTNGELLRRTTSGGVTAYAYDVLGNLRSVTLPDGTLIEYVIDALHRRVGKRMNGTLVQAWVYDGQLRPIAELDPGTGAVVARFVYASRAHVPDYVERDGATYRILADHLGSPRLVVDVETGAIAQRLDYDEFGRVSAESGTPGFQPFGFAGGLYDRDTGLLRFGRRDYDAETGRWTAKDPIMFRGADTNLYGYVLNDPVNATDASGLLPCRDSPCPGYNYCGKGYRPFEPPPTCALDEACSRHDRCYGEAGLSADSVNRRDPGQDDGPSLQDACDDALCSAALEQYPELLPSPVRQGIIQLFCDP